MAVESSSKAVTEVEVNFTGLLQQAIRKLFVHLASGNLRQLVDKKSIDLANC